MVLHVFKKVVLIIRLALPRIVTIFDYGDMITMFLHAISFQRFFNDKKIAK
jgi:hypothetical protein